VSRILERTEYTYPYFPNVALTLPIDKYELGHKLGSGCPCSSDCPTRFAEVSHFLSDPFLWVFYLFTGSYSSQGFVRVSIYVAQRWAHVRARVPVNFPDRANEDGFFSEIILS
jgi:hypothetical protein